MTRLIQLASVLLFSLSSCVTVGGDEPVHEANLGPWVEATPKLQYQIDENSARLPWTHGIERVELIQWFARTGEPAYPTMLRMVSDPRSDVAGAALAALGATRDTRLVEPLRELPWPDAEHSDLALERARTLLRLGDWSMITYLIDGLADERVMIRALCSQALFEATHERLGYDPKGTEEQRAEGVGRWRGWWSARQSDPMR